MKELTFLELLQIITPAVYAKAYVVEFNIISKRISY